MIIEASTPEISQAIDNALSQLGYNYQKSIGEASDIFLVFLEDPQSAYALGTAVGKQLISR